jgi:DNA-binding transcriptional MerR regulator
MQINTFAEAANVPATSIRYYEAIGLLPEPRPLDNGYRDYAAEGIDRLRLIAGARSLGLSLDDIGEILALRDRREAPCRVVQRLLKEKAEEISRRIAELRRLEAELQELHILGLTFPTDDVEGKACVCHLIKQIDRKDEKD